MLIPQRNIELVKELKHVNMHHKNFTCHTLKLILKVNFLSVSLTHTNIPLVSKPLGMLAGCWYIFLLFLLFLLILWLYCRKFVAAHNTSCPYLNPETNQYCTGSPKLCEHNQVRIRMQTYRRVKA